MHIVPGELIAILEDPNTFSKRLVVPRFRSIPEGCEPSEAEKSESDDLFSNSDDVSIWRLVALKPIRSSSCVGKGAILKVKPPELPAIEGAIGKDPPWTGWESGKVNP